MMEILFLLLSYLKKNAAVITSGFISMCIFLVVFVLYSLPLEPVFYSVLLVVIFTATVGIIGFVIYSRRHLTLKKLSNSIGITDYMLPKASNLIEMDYQELIKVIDKGRTNLVNEKSKTYSEMIDYFTVWAHQIKTPIAAMRLILQSEKSDVNEELLEQLFKTEQYVEMVLQYLRLDNLNADLMFKKYPLDGIVKQAVRKYSKLFIRKKIKLNYHDLSTEILTDEKWMVFVVEQIISNSLKYTSSGEISIYMDKERPETLVIEDTGMGIEMEDLPRVFEKGFTGYNGRLDKRSTGIGLYLCKQIVRKLSHTIEIESEVGKGTKVKINFQVNSISFE